MLTLYKNTYAYTTVQSRCCLIKVIYVFVLYMYYIYNYTMYYVYMYICTVYINLYNI